MSLSYVHKYPYLNIDINDTKEFTDWNGDVVSILKVHVVSLSMMVTKLKLCVDLIKECFKWSRNLGWKAYILFLNQSTITIRFHIIEGWLQILVS